jgi:N-acetylglutamate synthase-like GNAT family acetyltransferase
LNIRFRQYTQHDKKSCLGIFDLNCPEYFAPNERDEYEEFLDEIPNGYQVCLIDDIISGAFGLFKKGKNESRLNWILIDPNTQGTGLGSLFVDKAIQSAKELKTSIIHIATSQEAYKFFQKKGAIIVLETKNGWGPNMDKIEMELHI